MRNCSEDGFAIAEDADDEEDEADAALFALPLPTEDDLGEAVPQAEAGQ